ncbi:MAG: deAMPylase SidD family protein [Tatlockia sp.]|jgi:hypothetical protein
MYVIQQCNGTPTTTKRKKLDNGQSAISAGSTYLKFENGSNIAKPKPSDDKMVLGYTYDGLPFQIVVDGMFGTDDKQRNTIFQFIDENVTSLMDQYARDLSDVTKNQDEITKALIQTVRVNRPDAAEFTMSIAVTYERDGQLYCSGFGVGDTAIALLRHGTKEVEQLVTHNKVNNFKDAFDRFTAPLRIEELVERNTLFTTSITANDELVGYTWLQEDLQEMKGFYTVIHNKSQEIPVQKIKLKIATIQEGTLYDYLLAEDKTIQARRIKNKQSGGDDMTLGQIIVPTPQFRSVLKTLFELEANIGSIHNPDLKIKARAVYTAAAKLICAGKKPESFMQDIALTNQLLLSAPGASRDELVAKYNKAAKKAHGSASTLGKALGLAMMALGAAVAVCGILICTGTLGVGLQTGAAVTVIGAAALAIGLGIFCKSRKKGLSKAMDDFAAAKKSEKEPVAEKQPDVAQALIDAVKKAGISMVTNLKEENVVFYLKDNYMKQLPDDLREVLVPYVTRVGNDDNKVQIPVAKREICILFTKFCNTASTPDRIATSRYSSCTSN